MVLSTWKTKGDPENAGDDATEFHSEEKEKKLTQLEAEFKHKKLQELPRPLTTKLTPPSDAMLDLLCNFS